MLQTITWTGSAARLLDQTKLPTETVYVDITNEKQMWDAIQRLVIRGAPAIGVAAAFGVYLGVRDADDDQLEQRLNQVCNYLSTSRPTAVNLFMAIERLRNLAYGLQLDQTPKQTKQRILNAAIEMMEEDNRACRAIGEYGADLLAKHADASGCINLLTHCNAGGLATVQYGTALAPVYVGTERGITFHVYVDETRPLLQGSRITAFELQQNGVPVTLICDNMAATVMAQGKVAAVIVGTDRVAANGDVANKIGTLGVAILAKHFGIPFYVAAPTSSIDMSLACGDLIPIEQRAGTELSHGFGRQTAPEGVHIFNPAFDVTPAALVTAIISEKGIVCGDFEAGLKWLMH